MKFEKIENTRIQIAENTPVTVTEMGSITEIQYMSRHNRQSRIIKLSSDEYLHIITGKICRFEKKSSTRLESENSIRKTMRRIRELVQTNAVDPQKVRWVTLTYRENMTDGKRLYEDFRRFNQRFLHHLKNNGLGKPSYIAVAEPQNRGAWHLHILYIWKNRPAPYIENDKFTQIWGHGFTKVAALKDENIANYLLAYLSDLDIPEHMEEFFPEGSREVKTISTESGHSKRIVKGLRLHLYPAHFNIVRHSRDIQKPVKKNLPYSEATKLVAGKELTYETTFRLSDDKGFETIINQKTYKGHAIKKEEI